jgi:hypothetical protein
VPLRDVRLALRRPDEGAAGGAPVRVFLARSGESLTVAAPAGDGGGRIEVTVPRVDAHEAVVFEGA